MKILMVVLLSIMAFVIWSAIFYDLFGWFKGFYHDILDWHIPDTKKTKVEGYTETSICACCGRRIMRDPRGNWFRY